MCQLQDRPVKLSLGWREQKRKYPHHKYPTMAFLGECQFERPPMPLGPPSAAACPGRGAKGSGVGGRSVHLHGVLLDELEEAEGVGELQADGAAVEGGGSLPQHLLIPVLAELGHQLRQQTIRVTGRVRGSCLMWLQRPTWPHPPGAEEGGVRGPLYLAQPLRVPIPGQLPPTPSCPAPRVALPGRQAPKGPLSRHLPPHIYPGPHGFPYQGTHFPPIPKPPWVPLLGHPAPAPTSPVL